MEYRYLGGSGLEVSAIGLGCNTFGHYVDEAQATRIIHQAIDLGVTFVDTGSNPRTPAEEQSSTGSGEEYLGRALQGKRHHVVLAVKAGTRRRDGPQSRGGSRKHLVQDLEACLKRLRTDYVDVVQVRRAFHRAPAEETASTLDNIVRQGKALYAGFSNWDAWWMGDVQLTARSQGWVPFISAQNGYNMLNREVEREIMPCCLAHNIGIIPYWPLAGGFLTGKYRPGQPPPEDARGARTENFQWLTESNFAALGKLEDFAAKRGHTIADLAIAWLLARPGVSTVIIGATRAEQVEANVKGGDWKLAKEDMDEIEEILPVSSEVES